MQLRRSDEARAKSEERRQRENDTWRRKIEELQRHVEAKERIHFGPEGEDELEKILRRHFPADEIERRDRVGDVIQTIIENHEPCGKIVYECKRTSTWQVQYIRQLKQAMEAHETRFGVLVTRVLPQGYSGLCVKEGVIVATPHLAHHLVAILRDMLIELSRTQLSEKGKEQKTAEIYRYLRSEEFKNCLQAINSRIKELRDGLEREKSSHEGWWTRREQAYAAIARQTAGVTTRINEILSTAPKRQLAQVHHM